MTSTEDRRDVKLARPWRRRAAISAVVLLSFFLGMHVSAITSVIAGLKLSRQRDESRSWTLPPRIAGEVRLSENVVFGRPNAEPLRLDVYRPPPTQADRTEGIRPVPVVVAFHGGGFVEGNRNQIASFARDLASHGFAVVTADYRKYPGARIGQTLADARCAVRWAHAHAAEFGFDVSRVATMGRSSGGYLALMMALMPDEGDSSVCEAGPSRVDLVISEAGPTDLDPTLWAGTWRGAALQGFFGRGDPVQLSPVRLVSAVSPPALIFHGTSDGTVPYTQSRILEAAYRGANRDVRLVTFADTDHDPITFHYQRGLRETLHWLDVHFSGS